MTPWTVARQAPLSMEFSRQEYWSGLPFPSLTKQKSGFNKDTEGMEIFTSIGVVQLLSHV